MSEENTVENKNSSELLRLTVEVAIAYLQNNSVTVQQIPELISMVHASLVKLENSQNEPAKEPLKPAVPIKKSVQADYIVCLEDGKRLKMLKRHLRTTYNMTPDDYRAKWGLASNYPMVAPNYAAQRSEFAKKIGLGRSTVKRGGRRTKAS
ncbi:MAG: MucR family transcriptional regulator [Proteobacteria bacterium]|nr:MucR family transcriptional regulator [Pseudomonadota bacterium]